MALTVSQITNIAARLTIIEALLARMLEALPAALGENVLESMTTAERKFLREEVALYKTIIQAVRTKGGASSTASDITRQDVAKLYFDAQVAMTQVGEATRKLRALAAPSFEDAPISAEQKTVWEAKLTDALTALDAALGAFPGE